MNALKLFLIGRNLIPHALLRYRLNQELKNHSGRYPNLLKQATVLEYAQRYSLRTFIETGTYYGEMIRAALRSFDRIYSVEIEPNFYRRACSVFRKEPHVTILQGDSATVLPGILQSLAGPALFWLDAHYSGGLTGSADTECPTSAELLSIFAHPYKHVILIDDADCFTGDNSYPPLSKVEQMAAQHQYSFAVKNNIIRLGQALPNPQTPYTSKYRSPRTP